MTRLLWAAVLCAGLSGCERAAEPEGTGTLRDPDVPVASQTNATLTRLRGTWVVVDGAPARIGTRAEIAQTHMRLGARVFALDPLGEGRFRHENGQIWVLWMDTGARTVALGDPKGTWVVVLDRTGHPQERLRVAREILDWYGYHVDRFSGARGEQQ